MTQQDLEIKLLQLIDQSGVLGYTVKKPLLFIEPVFGNKLAYYNHGSNKIVMHDHFVETAEHNEIINTLIHELAHAIAEQNNTEDKRVWHGEAWKDINSALGGNAERYHQGGYKKPEYKKLSMAELYAIQPKRPATDWERGTFKQWLSRGYHVMKGQKGILSVWEFSADEYETSTDGKTSNWGRASAVYFTPEQVERNEVK